MIKRLLIVLLLLAPFATGQSTTVSATVVDSSSQVWANGTYTISFRPVPNQPGPYIWNGAPLTATQFTGTMNGSGVFSVSIPSSDAITPAKSQWTITVCPSAASPCGTIFLPITGSSEDVSAQITAAIPPVHTFPTPMGYAYADSQVQQLPGLGQSYFNTTQKVPKYWDGSAWQTYGSGSGTIQPAPQFRLFIQPNAGTQAVAGPAIIGTNAVAPILQNQYNANLYQTSPGSNDGLANAEAAAGTNGTTFAPSNYAATEAPGFAAAANTIVTDYRAGTRVFQHNSTSLDENVNFFGKQQSNCLVDGALSTTSYTCFGHNSFFVGPGIDLGSSGGWTTHIANYTNFTSYTAGIQTPDSGAENFYAIGDSNRYHYCNFVGGWLGAGDEGANCLQRHTTEATNMFTATVSTGGAGASTITTSPTSSGSTFNAGGNGQYTGGMLLDLTQVADSGLITAVAAGPPQVLTTSTTHTASTVYGTTSTAIPNPGNWPTGSSQSFTLTTPSAGTFAVGDEFCFGGPQHWEESFVTAVTGSAGAQTITANMTYPNGTGALVVKGACQAITLSADYVAGLMDPAYVVIGAPSTTSYWVGYYCAVGRDCGILSGANSAAIVPQPQATSGTVTRASNIATATLVSDTQQAREMNQYAGVVISGCADSSFDGTVTPTTSFSDSHTISWPNAGANATTTGCVATLTGTNGYHVYPMAAVVDVADPAVVGTKAYLQQPTLAIDGWFRLGHNVVNWTAGDSIEQPHSSSVLSGSDSDFATQNSPTPPQTESYGISHSWSGRANTGTFTPITMQNELPIASFQGHGGPLPPIQNFARLSGIMLNGLEFPFAPEGGAALNIGCFGAVGDDPHSFGSDCSSVNFTKIFQNATSANGGVAFLAFQPSTATYQWTAGLVHLTGAAQVDGLLGSQNLDLKYLNGNPGVTFSTSSALVDGITLCWPNDTVGELDVTPTCTFDAVPYATPTGTLNAGSLQANVNAYLNGVNIGAPLASKSVSSVYTGAAGSTQHVFALVLTGPTGADGPIQLNYASGTRFGPGTVVNNAVATFDASDYVTITCPTAMQANAPSGSAYTVWADIGGSSARRLGTCPLGGTLKDDGSVSATSTINIANNWTGSIGAAIYDIGYGGGIGAVPTPGSTTPDTWFYRKTANGWCASSTLGGSCNGDIAASTFNGKGVCASDGTNCAAGIANVQVVLPTATLTANTCSSVITTTMPGVTTTSTFTSAFATDASAVTGYGSSGGLSIVMWPTANTNNLKLCNPTASSITPGAMTINVGAR